MSTIPQIKTSRERTILEAYFGRPSAALPAAIAALDLNGQAREGTPTILDAAVAAVLRRASCQRSRSGPRCGRTGSWCWVV